MWRARIASIGILSVLWLPELSIAQNKMHSNPTVFYPDYENAGFGNAQPPSDSVLDAVLKKAEADGLAEEIEQLNREQKRALFEVVPVRFGPVPEDDFVVHGKPPMIGADCEWFWIVRVKNGKGQALLFSNGLELVIGKHEANGYRDIEVSWATAAVTGDRVYRFDGSSYRLFRERSKEQKP